MSSASLRPKALWCCLMGNSAWQWFKDKTSQVSRSSVLNTYEHVQSRPGLLRSSVIHQSSSSNSHSESVWLSGASRPPCPRHVSQSGVDGSSI